MFCAGGSCVASRGSPRGLIGFSSGPYQSGGRPCLSFHLRCVRFPLARTRARWPRRKPTVEWGYDINYIYIYYKGETSLPSVRHIRSTLSHSSTVFHHRYHLTVIRTLVYPAGLFLHHTTVSPPPASRNPKPWDRIIDHPLGWHSIARTVYHSRPYYLCVRFPYAPPPIPAHITSLDTVCAVGPTKPSTR